MRDQQITIFIHGTTPPDAIMSIPPVRSFFFCPPGLSKATELDQTYHTAKIAHQLCAPENTEFDRAHFYLFGWSGTLSHQARKEAAQQLHMAVENLRSSYAQQEIRPHIMIITHSHGGNVALLLQEIVSGSTNPDSLHIDELILLACPVQTETEAHAHSPLFKKIYSIHSHSDLLQVLDPQGMHSFLAILKKHGLENAMSHFKERGPLFSSRHFEPAPHIIQMNITFPLRELFHIDFLLPDFISELPLLLLKMREVAAYDGKEITHTLKS
jgi:hypothetical protein